MRWNGKRPMATGTETSARIRRLRDWPVAGRRAIQFVLLDIDDTLTTHGHLTARAYDVLERLSQRGLRVIPVTGRPAGWCDLIARFWPVDAVIGEDGAFWFRYDRERRSMTRRFWLSEEERSAARERPNRHGAEILSAPPRPPGATQPPRRGGPRRRARRTDPRRSALPGRRPGDRLFRGCRAVAGRRR